jgi:hypothetical protein
LSHFLVNQQGLVNQRGLVNQQAPTAKPTLTANAGDPSSELVGQPYAFDIAVYGDTCDLTSLTRYIFRNLIQGRPVYDDVSVINGKTIATREPGVRVCSPDLATSRTTVTLGR